MKINRNVVVAVVMEGNNTNCGGGLEGLKSIEMWWW